jgi:hypothetical protein
MGAWTGLIWLSILLVSNMFSTILDERCERNILLQYYVAIPEILKKILFREVQVL